MKEIGARMRLLREAAGITQKDIAAMCGSNQTTIAKMETGKTAPSIKILIWWADKFDVSLDYLCCRTDKPEGKMYECRKPPEAVENDKRQFIEMCFDSKSPESKRLKELLFQMWTAEEEEAK